MKKIDTDLNVTTTEDPEVKQYWYPLSIHLGYRDAFDAAKQFISEQGRVKYIEPVYHALLNNGYR